MNIDRIMQKYGQSNMVLTSAIVEIFLRKLHKQNFIEYHEGTDYFETADTKPESKLIKMDERTKK